MKEYKDLTAWEQNIFNRIEGIFMESIMCPKSFVTVLGVLINKHKIRRKKNAIKNILPKL